jgi:hypothetical protein
MRKILLGLVFLLFSSLIPAQQTLDNDAVIKLSKAGLSDDLIITTINASPGHYDVSPDGLIALKAAQLSDKVVAAIVLRANGTSSNTAPGTAPAAGVGSAGTAGNLNAEPGSPGTGPNGLPVGIDDVGVYRQSPTGGWISMLPEIVNFQSSDKLKNIASVGIMKSDLNGRIEGSRSSVNGTLPVVFAVYLPETVEITEYLLLRLHPVGNARTFLSAAGGLLHTQAGAQRDEIDFQPEKLAPRLYQITLPATEGKGEYGLLAPGNTTTPNKEESGKIYTVSIAE